MKLSKFRAVEYCRSEEVLRASSRNTQPGEQQSGRTGEKRREMSHNNGDIHLNISIFALSSEADTIGALLKSKFQTFLRGSKHFGLLTDKKKARCFSLVLQTANKISQWLCEFIFFVTNVRLVSRISTFA